MCFLVDDDEEKVHKSGDMDTTSSSSNSGSPRLQLKNHRTWLIPRKILMVILMVAVLMIFLGMVLMAIGGGIGSTGLTACGGVMFGLGIIGIIVCLLLCLFAFFYYGRKDAAVQTGEQWADDFIDAPGYASINRPSALKTTESTLKRNGMNNQQKKVTMAPGVGPYGESPPNVIVQDGSTSYVINPDGTTTVAAASASGGARSPAEKVADPRGVLGRSLSGGSDVGTGGIRITSLDGSAQPFPSPGGTTYVYRDGSGQTYQMSRDGQLLYPTGGGGQAGGQVVYSGGGSSASSSVIDAGSYAYPRSAVDGSSSQYSTLRSIPVTHIVTGEPQGQQQQQQFNRHQQETVEYARVNKPVAKGGSLPAGSSLGSSSHSYVIQNQGQRFPVEEDFDYDNPVERTPMISGSASMGRQRAPSNSSNMSYHEQQMQFQRQKMRLQQQQQQQQLLQQQQQQQQQHRHNNFVTHHTTEELYGPRQLGTQSLQRQYASNPYHHSQQQQQNYHTYSASSSSRRGHQQVDDLPPEPQPLVYPSARRPMTFEQVSSSKMSVYDNVLAGMKDVDEEEE